MKTRKLASVISLFAACAAFSAPALADDKVPFEQVPAPVKETIQKHVQDGKLDSIEKETEKGKPTVYEVEYTTKDGKEFELKIAEDGKLLAKEED